MVKKVNLGPVSKQIQSHLIELKISILINFKVFQSKNNEFKPNKVKKGKFRPSTKKDSKLSDWAENFYPDQF